MDPNGNQQQIYRNPDMKKQVMLSIGALFLFPASAFAGSATFSTVGSYTFMVPPYTGTLAVSIKGGGGGGGGGDILDLPFGVYGGPWYEFNGTNGSVAGTTYINGNSYFVSASGGGGGGGGRWDGSYATVGSAGSGNVSTGGGMPGGAGGPLADWVNQTLIAYDYRIGWWLGGAGGPGGVSSASYTTAQAPMGSAFSVVIGAVGAGGPAQTTSASTPGGSVSNIAGSDGSPGQVVFTWTDRANTAPVAPAITGPAADTINLPASYSFSATDPEGDNVRYGVDWNNDSVVDSYYPSGGSVSSGASATAAHTWSANGTYTFKVLATDGGLSSGWTSKTITVSNPTAQTLLCNGLPELYTIANTYPRFAPGGFSSLVIELWGGGGGGAGSSRPSGLPGGYGVDSTFGSLSAGRGSPGGLGTNPTGGAGGIASGGDINTNGGAGLTNTGYAGTGGSSPNGGSGGYAYLSANAGGAPGGGGGGGGFGVPLTYSGGGGGGGAYVKKTYTMATLAPGTLMSLVVGSGGAGAAGTAGKYAGGAGAIGKVKVTCTPINPTGTLTTDIPLIGGVYKLNTGSTGHLYATFAGASGDPITASLINNGAYTPTTGYNNCGQYGCTYYTIDNPQSVSCANVSPYSASCWTAPDTSKTYTFTAPYQGTFQFPILAHTVNVTLYYQLATLSVQVDPMPSLSITANGQSNALTVSPGQSATIAWSGSYVQAGSCSVTNSGDSAVWAGNSNAGSSTPTLATDRTYVLNCKNYQGNPATPVSVGIQTQALLPTLNSGSLTVSPTRVRSGRAGSVSWSVAGLSAGTSCSISPALSTGVASWDGVGAVWQSAGPVATNAITTPTQFTLTCTNGTSVSQSATVGLIPVVKEI